MRAHAEAAAHRRARRHTASALAFAVFCFASPAAHAFSKLGFFWLGGTVTLQLQLGLPAAPLSDGSTSWNNAAEAAANDWNLQLGRVRFATVTAAPPAASTDLDHVNNVFFSRDIYGLAFDARTLAVTLADTLRSAAIETDVIVNENIGWDSYRGPLRRNANGTTMQDLRRVLLHEFGHALGLDHPDEARPVQSVSAVMNSTVSNIETLQADDISGLRTLYFPNNAVSITTSPASVTKNLNEIVSFSVTGWLTR